jgi:phosphatidate cytidylyltransferase
LAKRIFSTLLLWAIIIATLFGFGAQGGVWLIALLGVATQHEFYHLLAKMGHRPFQKLGLGFGAAMLLAPYYIAQYAGYDIADSDLTEGLIAAAVVIGCLRVLRERDAATRVETLASTLFGLIYIPFMLQFLVRILMMYEEPGTGLALCLWLVATAKFCDVGALLTGLAVGRTKMAPDISPKKTWEGAVGGIVLATAVGTGIVGWFCHYRPESNYFPESFTPAVAAPCALLIAATAILSDLIESIIKRRADLKDTGAVIPGIGGVFDLTDSLVLTAPLGYALFCFLT